MDATEAKHWGLAQPRRAEGQGLAKAREIAQQLPMDRRCCSRRSSSCCGTRRWSPKHEALSCTTLAAVQQVVRSDDLKEGARAFTEKRKPRWKGR